MEQARARSLAMDKRKPRNGKGGQGGIGRGRWTEREGQQAVAAWRRSGLSASEFARRHALNPQRLCWWRKRLGKPTNPESGQTAAAVSTVSFVPAEVRAPAMACGVVPAVVRLPCDVAIEFGDAEWVTPRWIAALVGELSRPS
jgi:transposase-like protein